MGAGREVARKLGEVYAATSVEAGERDIRASYNCCASDERRKAQAKLEHSNRNLQELGDGDVIIVNTGVRGR